MSDRERILHFKQPGIDYEDYEANLKSELTKLAEFMTKNGGKDGGYSWFAKKVDDMVIACNKWLSPFELLPVQDLPKTIIYEDKYVKQGIQLIKTIDKFYEETDKVIKKVPAPVSNAMKAKRVIVSQLEWLVKRGVWIREREGKRLKDRERFLQYKHPAYKAMLEKSLDEFQRFIENHDGNDYGFKEFAEKVDDLVDECIGWLALFEKDSETMRVSGIGLERTERLQKAIEKFLQDSEKVCALVPRPVSKAMRAKSRILEYIRKSLIELQNAQAIERKRIEEENKKYQEAFEKELRKRLDAMKAAMKDADSEEEEEEEEDPEARRERILHYKQPGIDYEYYEAILRRDLAALQKFINEHDGNDYGFPEFEKKVDSFIVQANQFISPFELLPIQHLPKTALYKRGFLEYGKKTRKAIRTFLTKEVEHTGDPKVVEQAKRTRASVLNVLVKILDKKLSERLNEAKKLKEKGEDPDASDSDSDSEMTDTSGMTDAPAAPEMTDAPEMPVSDDVLDDVGLSTTTPTISQVPITQKNQVTTEPIVISSQGSEGPKKKKEPNVPPVIQEVLVPAPYFSGEGVENEQANAVLRCYNELLPHVSPNTPYFYLTEGITMTFSQMQTLFRSRVGKKMIWLDDDTIKAWLQLLTNRSHIISNAKRIRDHSGFKAPIIEYVSSVTLEGRQLITLNYDLAKDRAVIIPNHVHTNHWILYVWQPYELTNTKKRSTRVYLYDSQTGEEPEWRANFLRNIAPYIQFGDERLSSFITDKTLDLVYVTPFYPGAKYRQKSDTECGYMLCWFANLISLFGIADANTIIQQYLDVAGLNNFIRTMIISFGVGYCYKKPSGFDDETLSVFTPSAVAVTTTTVSAAAPKVPDSGDEKVAKQDAHQFAVTVGASKAKQRKLYKLYMKTWREMQKEMQEVSKVPKKKPRNLPDDELKDSKRIAQFNAFAQKWKKIQEEYDSTTADMTQEEIDALEDEINATDEEEEEDEADVPDKAVIDITEADDPKKK